MKNTIKEKLLAYNGFGSAEGQYIDRAELFHSFLPGILTGIAGGVPMFMGIITLTEGGKHLTGHLKDLKKEIGYFIGGFGIVETAEVILPLVT